MRNIEKILEHNGKFVAEKQYEKFASTKYPAQKLAILTCMDARLTELLPAALGLKNGDAKIIKTAGAIISHPYGSVMRSLIVAVFALGVEEVLVVGHHDCGMQNFDAEKYMPKRALNEARESGVDVDKWLQGFASAEESVRRSVDMIRNHPFMPGDISVRGFVMDPTTGKLDPVA
ncbi:MAG: carbonic anhydrase [Rickettsiales bacterium]|jgi:carbonic anhydrase|nr:carbonic anhydrase [Rickettsiales bacterium]